MKKFAAYFEDNEVRIVEGEFVGNDGWWYPSGVKDTKEKALSALYEKFCEKARGLVSQLNELEKKRHIVANAYMEMQ